MIKFQRFLPVMMAMISVFPSTSFGACAGVAGATAPDMHPLAASSPAHMALLADPIYQHFQSMKERPSDYSRDMDPAAIQAAMDVIPMGDFRCLWAVHNLLGQLGFVEPAQRQIVGEYAALKVAELKAHPDKNMRSMAMYCWARGKLHALQKGQKDVAIGILREFLEADISDYLKIKLAGWWPYMSYGFGVPEDLDYGARTFAAQFFGYTMLGDMDGALSPIFRPYFFWKKAKRTLNMSPWEHVPERLGVIREAVEGSAADPYYSIRAGILGAFAPRDEGEVRSIASRIVRLESIDSIGLPPEIQSQLLQHCLSIYSYWSSEMSPEELEGRSEKIIEYGERILALGDRIPGKSRYSAINALLGPLSSRPPKEGMSLFPRDHVQAIRLFDESEAYRRARGLTPYLEDRFDLIRLFFNGGEGVRDLPRASAILADYEAIKNMEKNPSLYILMMELYALPDGFNEPELLRAATRISTLLAQDTYFGIHQISDPKEYFMAYLGKLVRQDKADVALKVLDILSVELAESVGKYGDPWLNYIGTLVQQFLQDNPGVGSPEVRQKLSDKAQERLDLLAIGVAKSEPVPAVETFKAFQRQMLRHSLRGEAAAKNRPLFMRFSELYPAHTLAMRQAFIRGLAEARPSTAP
jgi:hypothetical protein